MAKFSLPGGVGDYVRTIPFEDRRKSYNQFGMHNVLGDFTGSVQQNQSLYNKVQKQGIGPTVVAPFGGGIAAKPAAPKTPAVKPAAPAAPVYDTRPAAELTAHELAARAGVPEAQLTEKGIVPGDAQKTLSFLEEQAKGIDEASGGAAPFQDIMDTVDTNPDVILAREKASRDKTQNDDAFQLALDKLGYKDENDIADVTNKAAVARQKLMDALERSGLALSGRRDVGEKSIQDATTSSLASLKRGLSISQQDAYAKVLAQNENLDLSLAKTIVTAVNAEIKSRVSAQDKEQRALESFLAKQGLVRNPVTGEIIKSASEERAQAAQARAEASQKRAEESAARAERSSVRVENNSAKGNLLTLSEARSLNLPTSLVGTSEADLGAQIQAPTPPKWFYDVNPGPLSPERIRTLWKTFQDNFKKAGSSERVI